MSLTILKNANIYTSDDKLPYADTVVYSDGKIIFVGEESEAGEYLHNHNSKIYDMQKKMIIPGFIDAHIHPGMVSQSGWHIRLPCTENVDELLAFIKKYAEDHPKEEIPFLYFEYYPTSMFGTDGPTKELLDTAVSDRPCLCQDFGEHLHWMNSKMLELMEITKDTPDPVPGLQVFVRDENNEPTGWGKEWVWFNYMDKLWEKLDWQPPMKITPALLAPFFKFINENGITGIGEGILEGEDQIASMYEMDMNDDLNVYYDGAVRFNSYDELSEKIEELKNYSHKYCTAAKHLKINTMKLFLDGTNESGNSAILNEHANAPGSNNFGEILMDKDELAKCILKCNEEHLDIHIHMVGDRAFRVACDAVELAKQKAKKENQPWYCQPIFCHCEIIDPADMQRPAELGITINWSCHWSGGYFGEDAKAFLGEEKWNRMYQFNPIIDSGALVSLSSDVVTFYELNRANPFFGMQVAHTRVDPQFPLDPKRYPESMRPPESARLSREFLLKGYTINGARQLRLDHIMGSISPGKIANMLILSDDFFKVDPYHIKDIQCETVIFDGKILKGDIERFKRKEVSEK